jgi:hypothetical protein
MQERGQRLQGVYSNLGPVSNDDYNAFLRGCKRAQPLDLSAYPAPARVSARPIPWLQQVMERLAVFSGQLLPLLWKVDIPR